MFAKSSILLIVMATGASAKWTGNASTSQQVGNSATCAAARKLDKTWTTTSLVVTETTVCATNDYGVFQSIIDCNTMVIKTKQCTDGNAADWCSGTCSPINGGLHKEEIMELGDAASCHITKNTTTKAVAYVEVVTSVTNTQGNYWGERAKLCASQAQGWVGAAESTYVTNANAKCNSSALLNDAPTWTTSHMIVTKDTTCAVNEWGIYKNTYECTGPSTIIRKAGHTCTGGTFADPCSGSCTTPPVPSQTDDEMSAAKPCSFEPAGVSRTTVKADAKGDYWEEGNKLCVDSPASPSSNGNSPAPQTSNGNSPAPQTSNVNTPSPQTTGNSPDPSTSDSDTAALPRVTLILVLFVLVVLLGSH